MTEDQSGQEPSTRQGGVTPEPALPATSTAAKYAGLGLQFAVSIVVFSLGGHWLDQKLGTNPLFLILGVFGGAGGAFYSMYRKVMADQRSAASTRKRP